MSEKQPKPASKGLASLAREGARLETGRGWEGGRVEAGIGGDKAMEEAQDSVVTGRMGREWVTEEVGLRQSETVAGLVNTGWACLAKAGAG